MKEHSDIEDIVLKYREYKTVSRNLEEAKEMLDDPEMKELAEMEMLEAKEKLPKLEEELKILLIPKDPNDDNNVICEIRAGAGGEEAALFAGVLFRMYSMYAERKHFQIQVINENETGIGGYKEISFMITGKGAYIADLNLKVEFTEFKEFQIQKVVVEFIHQQLLLQFYLK